MRAAPVNRKLRKQLLLIVLCAVPLLLGGVVAFCYATPFSYVYCLAREKSWLAATTEADLDRRMWTFYSKRSISPSESAWGRDYLLKQEERMLQYRIFGKEDLDVVLDQNSNIVRTFTSYE